MRHCRADENGGHPGDRQRRREAYRGAIPRSSAGASRTSDAASSRGRRSPAGIAFWGYEDDGAADRQLMRACQPVARCDLIRHAYVVPGNQGRGVGRSCSEHLRASVGAPHARVGTWAAAEWAIRFYRRNGFEQVTPGAQVRAAQDVLEIPERQIETSVVLAHPPFEVRPEA